MASGQIKYFFSYPEGRAILISFGIGLLIVLIKTGAYLVSNSMAIMADMLESFAHNIVVLFAVYCMWYSRRPADSDHLYGHGKFQFLSSSVEGSLIVGTSLLIFVNSGQNLIQKYELLDIHRGIAYSFLAGVINTLLAWYLIKTGKKHKSIILEANGYHIFSDVVTTGGTLLGALLAYWTSIIQIDSVVAILAGLYILYAGLSLLRSSIDGLMDKADEDVDRVIRKVVEEEADEHDWGYHALRHRSERNRHWLELHLVFNKDVSLESAHNQATHLEHVIRRSLEEPITITTHLEPESEIDQKGKS